MKGFLLTWPRAASFLLLAALLAGCSANGPGGAEGEPSSKGPAATFSLNLTRADLADEGNLRALLRVVEGGEVDASVAMVRPQEPPETWEGCGGVMMKHVRAGAAIAEKGFFLSESRGHALIVPNGGDPVVVPGGTIAPESLSIGVSPRDGQVFRVEKGDHVLLDLSLRDGAASLYDGYINVTALNATLEVVSTSASRFVCGANLGNFSGGGFSTGVGGLTPTVVRDSRLAERGDLGVEASFIFVMDRRSGGTCDLAILVEGAEANASGRQMDACAIRATGGAGEVAFVIQEAVASGPVVSYALWDRAPWATEGPG